MITPKVLDTKVVFGPGRLSYTHLFEKHSFDGDPEKGKYSCNILIPKSAKETVEAINKAIETATNQAIVSKWGGKKPKISYRLCVMAMKPMMKYMQAIGI